MQSGLKKYIDYISKSRDELGGHAICPYAKKFSNEVLVVETEDLLTSVKNYVTTFPTDKKVVVLISSPSKYHYHNLVNICNLHQTKDLWLAPDHPTRYNEIGGIRTNNEEYAMILIQDKKHLNEYSEKLKDTDYYSYWSKEYYEEIMNGRME